MSQPVGRGRARGRPAPQGGAGAGARPGAQSEPRQPAPPSTSAWPRPSAPQPSQPNVDKVTQQLAATAITGGGDAGLEFGRGAVRGRRRLDPVELNIKTKPETCMTKMGRNGAPVNLYANYFKLACRPDWMVFQYRVDFSEDEDRIAVRRSWLRQHREALGNSYLFDGTMLFSVHQFLQDREKPLTLMSKKLDGSVVKIDIKWAKKVDVGDPTYILIYNLLVRRCMGALDLQLVGRNLFDPKEKHEIKEFNLSVWPGYLTSIRQHENDLLMCCELSFKVMRLDTAHTIWRDCRGNERQFNAEIIGQVVMTPYNNKTYRIDDVDFKRSPRDTFDTREGPVSFIEYYKKRYNININDDRQPLLISRLKAKDIRGGQKDNIVLIPEVCTMTGITDQMRNNFQLMRALAGVTHVAPQKRMEILRKLNNRLQSNASIQSELKGWDMKLSPEFVKLRGRQLKDEVICYKDSQQATGPQADWTNVSLKKPMYSTAVLKDWVVISPERSGRDTQSFVSTMQRVARPMNFEMHDPSYLSVPNDSVREVQAAIEKVIARSEPQLLMIVLNSKNTDKYSAIKTKCYVDRAISSQVVCARNLTKNQMTIATKVAIQINCKLGGAPWTLNVANTGAMVVGFDVCHSRGKSYGAFVASSNPHMTHWYCNATLHTDGHELSNGISLDIGKALRRWFVVNQNLPSRVIVYRDGVGDGQIGHVYRHEVACVKNALKQMYGDNPYRLGYIIVTKRINTRLFTENGQNPMPGLVVDDVITLPEKYDFYLVSQFVKQGTASPTSYNVIEDNLGWDPDKIQRLTYMLTHLYYNLSATVAVPAPVQYAHKLAFLVGESLHRLPNVNLSDRLFFI